MEIKCYNRSARQRGVDVGSKSPNNAARANEYDVPTERTVLPGRGVAEVENLVYVLGCNNHGVVISS